jgi:hypothetical protein
MSQAEMVGSEEYGRMYNINYDPVNENTLYATSLGNHIVKSTDNGVTWDVFYSMPEECMIMNLRFLPNNKLSFNTNYTGNEDAICVFDINTKEIEKKYTPPMPPNADSWSIREYDFFDENTDIAIVLQSYLIGLAFYEKVYYTSDAAENWNIIYYTPDFGSIGVNDVAIHPNNPNKLFLARANSPTDIMGGLLVSEDAGDTYSEKLPGVLLNAITFNPENPDEMMMSNGTNFGENEKDVFRSFDGGDTWTGVGITG